MIKIKPLITFAIVLLIVISLGSESVNAGFFSDVGNALGNAGSQLGGAVKTCFGLCGGGSTGQGGATTATPESTPTPLGNFQEFKYPFSIPSSDQIINRIQTINLDGPREIKGITGQQCGKAYEYTIKSGKAKVTFKSGDYKLKYYLVNKDTVVYSFTDPTKYTGYSSKDACYTFVKEFNSISIAKDILVSKGYPVADKIIIEFIPDSKNAYLAGSELKVHASKDPITQPKVILSDEKQNTFVGPILVYLTKKGSDGDFTNLRQILTQKKCGIASASVELCSSESGKSECALNDENLKKYSQLWILDNNVKSFSNEVIKSIINFNNNGGGVFIASNGESTFTHTTILENGAKKSVLDYSWEKFNNENLPKCTKDPDDPQKSRITPPTNSKYFYASKTHAYARNVAEFLEPSPYTSQSLCESETRMGIWTGSNCCELKENENNNWYYNDILGKLEGVEKVGGCWNNTFVASEKSPKDDKKVINIKGEFYYCKDLPSGLPQVKTVTPVPDLSPTELNVGSSQVSAGSTFTVDTIVRNIGGAVSPQFLVRFSLLYSAGSEVLIGAAIFPSTQVDQSSLLTKTLSIPKNIWNGKVKLKVAVDPDKKIGDSDYSNNEIISKNEIDITGGINQAPPVPAQTPQQQITPQPQSTPNPSPIQTLLPPFTLKKIDTCGSIKNKDETYFKIQSGSNKNKYIGCNYAGEFEPKSELFDITPKPSPLDVAQKNCCTLNECFNGTKCVNSEDSQERIFKNPSDKKLLSICTKEGKQTAAWEPLFLKSTQDDETKEGEINYYCKSQSQCLYKSDTKKFQCIDSGQSFENKYCHDGKWTSKTKFLIEQLLSYGKNDFEIVCGSATDSLNEFSEEYFGIYKGKPKTNSVCVLKKGNDVLFGTTSNVPVNHFNSVLEAMDIERDSCDSVANSPLEFGQFSECIAKNNKKILYSPSINATIFSPSSKTLPTNTLDFSKLENEFKPINDVMNSFEDIVSTEKGNEMFYPYKFASQVKYFDNIFYQEKSNKKIFGFLERVRESDGSYSFIVGVKYTEIGQQPLRDIDCAELTSKIDSVLHSGPNCIPTADKQSIIILSKMVEDPDDPYTEASIKQIWKDLTQKLRLQ